MDVLGGDLETDKEFMVKEMINIENIKDMKQQNLLIPEKQESKQERKNNHILLHGTVVKSVHNHYNANTEYWSNWNDHLTGLEEWGNGKDASMCSCGGDGGVGELKANSSLFTYYIRK